MSTVIIGGRVPHNYDSHTVVKSQSSICYQSTCSAVAFGSAVTGGWGHLSGLSLCWLYVVAGNLPLYLSVCVTAVDQ